MHHLTVNIGNKQTNLDLDRVIEQEKVKLSKTNKKFQECCNGGFESYDHHIIMLHNKNFEHVVCHMILTMKLLFSFSFFGHFPKKYRKEK